MISFMCSSGLEDRQLETRERKEEVKYEEERWDGGERDEDEDE